MTVLLQISDPHFGTERPHVVEALAHLVRRESPDVLILSGDITQRARRAQFDAARAFVDRLGVATVIAIPGNHDLPLYNLPLRLVAPYAGYRRAFGADLEPTFESADVLVVAVNTTRAWRHTDGTVSAAQVERVAQRLERADDAQLRIVVTHQPIAVARAKDEPDLLHGHAAAIARWSAAGADMVLGGHIHLPYRVRLHARDGASQRPLWVVQAGTATSSRLRHDTSNSVNLIRCVKSAARRGCNVERWDHAAASNTFERVDVELMRFSS